MYMRRFIGFSVAALVATLSSAATAQVVLDFEGLRDYEQVQEFYNGGTGSMGSTSSLNAGASFPGNTLAIIDADAGGSGNFANEPSPDTVMFFLSPAASALMNMPAGFTGGFSFFYTSSVNANVVVYDGVDATGNVLATIPINAQHTEDCSGDPTGDFCNWTAAGASFTGVARSIDFGGTADQTAFDDITLGSATPGGGQGVTVPVPVLPILPLLALMAGVAWIGVRARKNSA